MNRRQFTALAPVFPAAAVTATLTLREEGKDPVDVDVSVLKLKPGDTLVLACHHRISMEQAERIKAYTEAHFAPQNVKAMVLSNEMSLEGVLRYGEDT